MVICLAEKKDADFLITKGLIEVGRKTAYIEKFQEQSQEKSQYFNCQQYGYKTSEYIKIPVCSNYFFSGHLHRNCQETQVCCFNYRREHLANSFGCPVNLSIKNHVLSLPTANKTNEPNKVFHSLFNK